MPKGDEPTAKQLLFVANYVITLNATEAASASGYKGSREVLQVTGLRLLRNARIASLIAAKQRPMLTKASVTHERTLTELARMAYVDPREVFTWGPAGVTVKESSELSEDAARAVMEVSETRSKDGTVTVRLKLHDKAKSLEMLARHLKLLGDAPNITIPIQVNIETLQYLGENYTPEQLRALLQQLPSAGIIEAEAKGDEGA